jgi:hypothetical protein
LSKSSVQFISVVVTSMGTNKVHRTRLPNFLHSQVSPLKPHRRSAIALKRTNNSKIPPVNKVALSTLLLRKQQEDTENQLLLAATAPTVSHSTPHPSGVIQPKKKRKKRELLNSKRKLKSSYQHITNIPTATFTNIQTELSKARYCWNRQMQCCCAKAVEGVHIVGSTSALVGRPMHAR